MSIMITRRTALLTPLAAASAFFVAQNSPAANQETIIAGLKRLEKRSRGRLGVAILDTATGGLTGHRLDERFAMCSTCKALIVAFTLHRVDRGDEQLDRRIFFTERDLVTPFKATKPHLASGMTIEELCAAAAIVSDSTAANLLMASFGGPAALTAYMRSLGDEVTRVDRLELALNIVKPGETHDTTSPRAMAASLQKIVLGDALSAASRTRLTGWMVGSQDAAARRLRVGLPEGWRIANKPGTWDGIATNDIGVIFPPRRAPIVVTAYLGEAPGATKEQEAILADVTRIVAGHI